MKYLLIALLAASPVAAIASSDGHCPAGKIDVWGACLDSDSGFQGGGRHYAPHQRYHHRDRAAERNARDFGCSANQYLAWGHCFNY